MTESLPHTHLQQLVQFIINKDEKKIGWILKKISTDKKKRLVEFKRQVIEEWYENFCNPDPQAKDKTLIRLLMENSQDKEYKHFEDQLLQQLEQKTQHHGSEYYTAYLEWWLIKTVREKRPLPPKRKRGRPRKKPKKLKQSSKEKGVLLIKKGAKS